MMHFVEGMSESELRGYIAELLEEYEKRFKKTYRGAYSDPESWIKSYLQSIEKSPLWKLSVTKLTAMLRRLLGIYINTGNSKAKAMLDNVVKELRLRDFYDLARQCQFRSPGGSCMLWGGDVKCMERNCPLKSGVISNVRIES